MGQHINTASDCHVHAIQILGMREDGQGVPVGLLNGGSGDSQGQHRNLSLALVRTAKQLDSMCAFGSVLPNESNRLTRGLGVRDMNVVLLKKVTNINRFNRPNRFTDCENSWSA